MEIMYGCASPPILDTYFNFEPSATHAFIFMGNTAPPLPYGFHCELVHIDRIIYELEGVRTRDKERGISES